MGEAASFDAHWSLSGRALARGAARFVLVMSLVGYPLVAGLSEYLMIPNRWVTVPFRALVLAASIVAVLLFASRRYKPAPHHYWVVWWFFWGVYLLRMTLDHFFDPDVLKLPIGEYLLYAVGVSLLPAVALSFRRTGAVSDGTVSTIIVLGALGLVLNLWVILFRFDLIDVVKLAQARVETEALNPISIGQLGVTVIILSLWKYLRPPEISAAGKLFLAACCVVAAAGIVLSASRGPVLSLAIVLPVLAWVAGARVLVVSAILFGALLAAIVWGGGISLDAFFLFERLSSSAFSDSDRSRLMLQAFDLATRSPLVGWGTEPLETYPHNVLLESFVIVGVFTGIPFTYLLGYALFASSRLRRVEPSAFWVSLLLIQYAVAAMVSGSIYFVYTMWALMALAVGQYQQTRVPA